MVAGVELTPEPTALRLVGLRPGRRSPRPPFGLRTWTNATEASLAVLLEASELTAHDVSALAAQIPDPNTLAVGVLVVVLGEAARADGIVMRLFHGPRVLRSVRGSALLSRGYVGIGAATDTRSGQDLVWGYVSPRDVPPRAEP